jgi:3',5'-cyclic-nucleotide phosphodiesterase
VYAAWKMLDHAQNAPEVEAWRLTPDELHSFCLACRAAYNSFVLYHNFRHAVDVLQFVFSMLLHIGALAPYGSNATSSSIPKSPIASLLTPIDALALMIAAIGHDVGHPGVNNVFLIKLNSPLAQLYNDSSVLESFHCAAFSQILRRHWPPAFRDTNLRKLLISSILATDMGVHFKFMKRMSGLQQRFQVDQDTGSWTPQDVNTSKALVCGLLIKCADISNVVSLKKRKITVPDVLPYFFSFWLTYLFNSAGSTVENCREMDKHASRRIDEPRPNGEGSWNGNCSHRRTSGTR